MPDTDLPRPLAADYTDARHALLDWRLGYSQVLDLLGPPAGQLVLDYGCGNGRFTRLLRDRGARLIGVDIDAESIAAARRVNCDRIAYHVIRSGDLSAVPPASMDGAVSTFVLCCVRDEAEMARIARAIGDRLAPGGRYVLAEPHPDAIGHTFYSMRRIPQGPVREGTPLKVQLLRTPGRVLDDFWHSREAYLRALATAGLAVEEIREPVMGERAEEPFWQDERGSPPFLILRAGK